MPAHSLLFAHGEPAAGVAAEDLIPAGIVALVILGAVAALALAHRTGRTKVLSRLAAVGESLSGLPGWAALPAGVAGVALLVAAFGFYWDVATHIDNGRDAGPFANPSHYFIIVGLAGIAFAGLVSILLGCDESRSSVRIRTGWHAPVGGVMLLLCGGVALLGFPLDDVWHRLFGQDVTLWSPTHIQMVGGAALSTLALWVLLVEGQRASSNDRGRFAREALTAGAFLIGLSALQAEFDYSVPQFRLLFHPVLLLGSAGVALVAARIRLGFGGALAAVAFFLAVRGSLSIVIGPVMGHTTLHFPLYLVEALAVEAVALRWSVDRPLSLGAAAGAAVGTVGLAAEWAWSHVWMTAGWPASLLPEGALLGFVAAIAGCLTGGYIGRSLTAPAGATRPAPRGLGAATVAAVLFVLGFPLLTGGPADASATVSLRPVAEREDRWVHATVELEPTSVAEGAEWFTVTAWQGGGSVVSALEPAGGGTYESTAPIPVFGEWKALIRLHKGSSISAVPIYLPQDRAIPAPKVPAESHFTRVFVEDRTILLREAKDVSAPLTYVATGVLMLLVATWVIALAWGLRRLESSIDRSAGSIRVVFRSRLTAPSGRRETWPMKSGSTRAR